jgi:hypothetical protein
MQQSTRINILIRCGIRQRHVGSTGQWACQQELVTPSGCQGLGSFEDKLHSAILNQFRAARGRMSIFNNYWAWCVAANVLVLFPWAFARVYVWLGPGFDLFGLFGAHRQSTATHFFKYFFNAVISLHVDTCMLVCGMHTYVIPIYAHARAYYAYVYVYSIHK